MQASCFTHSCGGAARPSPLPSASSSHTLSSMASLASHTPWKRCCLTSKSTPCQWTSALRPSRPPRLLNLAAPQASSRGESEPSETSTASRPRAPAAAFGKSTSQPRPSTSMPSDTSTNTSTSSRDNATPSPSSSTSSSTNSKNPIFSRPKNSSSSLSPLSQDDDAFSLQDFLSSSLPKKIGALLALIVFSRVGVYVRLPGVDVDSFAATLQASGLMSYLDSLAGGSISKVGIFSLGIIPYINASIVLQLMAAAVPALKRMQREEGAQGRALFAYYTKLLSFAFAVAQALGQLSYIRPYVDDFSPSWLAGSATALVAGSLALVYVADTISELKLGNGASILIFANIASSLPASLGALLGQSTDSSAATIYALSFLATTLGVVYVQEAERRIPINYSNRYSVGRLARQSYLPFKVNATGVMPLIFASSILALPAALAKYLDSASLDEVARALGPGGPLYVPCNIALIAFFNYYYTFLQLEPKDLAEQLKKQGAAVPSIRPGRQTAEFVTTTLTHMSILGSVFLGALAGLPALTEAATHVTALRGFAGTSVLILVGVATDTARRLRAEQAMAKYQDVEKLYDNMKM